MPARILLIDDDAGIRDSMRMPLEYEGYEYSSAASAEEGIAAIQRESPDIVFMDIKMPGMDGLEALTKITMNAPREPATSHASSADDLSRRTPRRPTITKGPSSRYKPYAA